MEQTAIAKSTKWAMDATHSEVQFKVKHLMISTVTGHFNRFEGTVITQGDDFTTSKIRFSADVDSIATNNDQRDAHLKNGDFFDAENYPKLFFEGDKVEKLDEEQYRIYGTLTIRGVTRRVALHAELGGLTNDPWGDTRAGFAVTGKINRQDFGVSFGAVTETGGLLLDNEVKIIVNAQFVRQKQSEGAQLSGR
jgi:polyisoprenoid-binding protein YceI